jgi:FtsZ-binding cell division protein ZapB
MLNELDLSFYYKAKNKSLVYNTIIFLILIKWRGISMEMEEFSKLEIKITSLVNHVKVLREENQQLKESIESLKKQTSVNEKERNEIKNKITSLIEVIDLIDQ